jgi:hypothetical protein
MQCMASRLEGTSARVFAGAGYTSGGKTGTAQAIGLQGRREATAVLKPTSTNATTALYVAFAPVENPTIALALIVENAGWGSTSAAPIARRVFDYWLLGQYPNEQGHCGRPTKGQAMAHRSASRCWLPTYPGRAAWRQPPLPVAEPMRQPLPRAPSGAVQTQVHPRLQRDVPIAFDAPAARYRPSARTH